MGYGSYARRRWWRRFAAVADARDVRRDVRDLLFPDDPAAAEAASGPRPHAGGGQARRQGGDHERDVRHRDESDRQDRDPARRRSGEARIRARSDRPCRGGAGREGCLELPRNLRTRAAVVLVVFLGSLWFLYPPKKSINLGLDLQGGIHLVLGVETDKHVASQT